MANHDEPLDDSPDWTTAETVPLDTALRLQSIRARLDLSQAELSALMRIPLSTLRNWEQNRTMPDAFTRRMIEVIYAEPEAMRERLTRESAA